jgi:hypothetical protein
MAMGLRLLTEAPVVDSGVKAGSRGDLAKDHIKGGDVRELSDVFLRNSSAKHREFASGIFRAVPELREPKTL